MKKMLPMIFVGILALSFLVSPARATVLVELNGTVDDFVDRINLTGPTSIGRVGKKINIPIVDTSLLASGTGDSGVTSMTSSTLVVPVGYSYIRKAIANDSAFTAGTLANGKIGQLLTIHITEDLGSEVFTVTPATSTGIASIGFDSVGEIATFLYIDDTSGWVLFGDTNATINLVTGL